MDRGGHLTINPFINLDGEKNLYNSRHPADDVANYLGPWSKILENGGYTPEAAGAAAMQALPDILHLPASSPLPDAGLGARTMEYLVTMTTHVPEGTSEAAVQDIRAREAARSRELAAQGHLLRLWRPPLQPGEWRTLGLFAADDGAQLEKVLASMPLRVWRTDEVTPLTPHPSDPALTRS